MDRILVIADDLSGAAEIAGIGVQHGLRARIARGEFTDDRNVDLVVIDSDTRHSTADEAAKTIERILNDVDRSAFQSFYKKTDSVLRGPVAIEINTVLRSLHLERALLMPQNPTLGRVIRDGQYFINNVPLDHTDFATDPEHPRTSSDAIALLGDQSQNITIASGESPEDLRALAARVNSTILPAGSADFFTAILETLGLTRVAPLAAIEISGDQLFVCGSASALSRRAVSDAAAHGIRCIAMPLELFHSTTPDERLTGNWSDHICAALRASGRVMMSVGHAALSDRARHVRRVIALTAARILAEHSLSALWIEGGATAAAIVEAKNWREFAVDGTLAPGVVALRTIGQPAQRIIIKPGSYAWPAGAL